MPPTDPTDHTMSFGDHLEELRRRLLLGLVAPLPLFIVFFLFSDRLIAWILRPVFAVLRRHDLPPELQVLSPPEFIIAKLKVSLLAAVIVASPWLVWQLWLFIAPGLYRHERRFVYLLLPGSAVLTLLGTALLYYVMLPLMLHVLVMFTLNADLDAGRPPQDMRIAKVLALEPEVELRTAAPESPRQGQVWLTVPELELYMGVVGEDGATDILLVTPPKRGRVAQVFRVSWVIDFTLVLALGVVIAFQMPLVIVLLGWLDLASVDWLRSKRRYALLVCAAVSAIITPADAVSLVIMLLPLYGLYELGILLLWLAPARAVADGRLGRRARSGKTGDAARPDKPPAAADQPSQPAESPRADGTPPDSNGDTAEERDE